MRGHFPKPARGSAHCVSLPWRSGPGPAVPLVVAESFPGGVELTFLLIGMVLLEGVHPAEGETVLAVDVRLRAVLAQSPARDDRVLMLTERLLHLLRRDRERLGSRSQYRSG